jgi:short-chain fatty acids transporter
MLARLGDRLCALFRATAPDPFVLAVLLTGLTFALALWLPDAPRSIGALVDAWSGGAAGTSGVWSLLKFAMQMCLILVTGHALAASPPVAWLIDRLALLPRSGAQAAALVALVAATLGVLNWGLGLVGGALLARRVGIAMEGRGVRAHYPLLAASGYVGLMVWHGGLSGSAPLTVNRATDLNTFLAGRSDLLSAPIPLSHTIFSPLNLIITGGLLIISPIVMALLSPPAAQCEPASSFTSIEVPSRAPRASTGSSTSSPSQPDDRGIFPRILEDTPIINFALALLIGAWAWRFYFPADPATASGVTQLGLDSVNLTMLMLALLLHGTPRRFLSAVDDAVRGCAGIIIQFPLYAGIMGVMHDSGLTAALAQKIAAASGPTTLPLFTFISASVVNLFVPSGGGQWVVQGPIALQAAKDAGVDPARMVMSVAYGDELTNMLQPFWALPLLAITGAKARDIVGYTAILMTIAFLWIAAWLVIL